MKIKEIRDLIDYISQSELNEVNIETTDFKLSVKKKPDVQLGGNETYSQPRSPGRQVAQSMPEGPEVPAGEPTTSEATPVKTALKEIKSPMIGTFYRSPNPESPSFVEVGDKIKPGQTVCIVEAMKLFNEIESEIGGTLVEVLVENASPVEFDQPLFLVDPS